MQYYQFMNLSFRSITDPMAFAQNLADDFEFIGYWETTDKLCPEYEWYEVRNGNEQVALLELDLKPHRSYWEGSGYPLPADGPDVIEIQFVDVRLPHRGRGIGTAIVHWVAERYPGHQILALAEESDGFWKSLGWELITPDNGRSRPMYASPLHTV